MYIDHVGVVVEDLDAAITKYRNLVGEDVVVERESVPAQKVEVALLSLGGGARLELLFSTDPEGPVGRYLAKRGPGIHHLALAVEDLGAELQRLQAAGAMLIDSQPRPGSHGSRVAFVHPRSAGGVLLELVECPVPPAEPGEA